MEDFNREKFAMEEDKKESEWFKFNEKKPKAKDSIIVKLIGCELDATHAFVYVREGEGLGGWFEEWRYASEEEKEEFGKKDCIYLKENKDE